MIKYEISQEEKQENVNSVLFKRPIPKDIISHHSGSILTNDEPIIQLTDILKEKITKIFNSKLNLLLNSPNSSNVRNENEISTIYLSELLHELNFPYFNTIRQLKDNKYDDETLIYNISTNLINKYKKVLSIDGYISNDQFLLFIERFQASSNEFAQRLRLLISRGQLKDSVELILRGCSIYAVNGEGLTAVHYICENNQLDILQILNILIDPLDINCKDKYQWTPLHYACHFGHIEIVEYLINLNADINSKDIYGKTPLHISAGQARNNIIELLLSSGASASDVCLQGMTAIHEAAFKGYSSTYIILSKHSSADLTIKDSLGFTPSDYNQQQLNEIVN